jgi:hypothetical protein
MPEPTPVALSHHFTALVNRRVAFKPCGVDKVSKAAKAYGVYTVFPQGTALVVKADVALLGSFAGALVGLPDDEVVHRLKMNPLDEVLCDPMKEVLNVASAAVSSDGRSVFKNIVFNPVYLGSEAESTVNSPLHRSYFNVEIEGYQGGSFCIFE